VGTADHDTGDVVTERQPVDAQRRWDSLAHLRDVALRELQQIDGVRSAGTVVLLDEIDRRDRPIWS